MQLIELFIISCSKEAKLIEKVICNEANLYCSETTCILRMFELVFALLYTKNMTNINDLSMLTKYGREKCYLEGNFNFNGCKKVIKKICC